MKDKLFIGIAAIFFAALIGSVIWWNVSIWNECRSDHSWSYCMRLLSK
jgi:hypothetical protein